MSTFILGIDSDFRKPGWICENGLKKIINNHEIEVHFLSKEKKVGNILAEYLENVDAFISLNRIINQESLQKISKLKWIGRLGAGFDNVDIAACTRHGILVSNAPQGLRESVAESVMGFMLALNCRLKRLDSWIRKYGFENKNGNLRQDIFQKTLGIIGFGGIASRILDLVEPFEMEILIYDPYADVAKIESQGGKKVTLDTLLKQSDYVSINVPLTKDTKGMLNKEKFKMMKKTAFLINTSRGGIYEDKVLAEVLKKEWIAGAGIDVFENEPNVSNNPLLNIENAILTPHTAGNSNAINALHKTEEILVNSVINIKNGEMPWNILNPEAVEDDIPKKYLSPSYIPS